jgi:hypothetical protein
MSDTTETSDKPEFESYSTWDFNATVKDISVSTRYIPALTAIINKTIMEEDKIETVGDTFIKFNKIVEAHDSGKEPEEKIMLDPWEADLYVLFSLLQTIKSNAIDQGYEVKTKTSATKEEVADLGRKMLSGEDVSEEIKALEAKLKVVK